jgi:hypothetical protein
MLTVNEFNEMKLAFTALEAVQAAYERKAVGSSNRRAAAQHAAHMKTMHQSILTKLKPALLQAPVQLELIPSNKQAPAEIQLNRSYRGYAGLLRLAIADSGIKIPLINDTIYSELRADGTRRIKLANADAIMKAPDHVKATLVKNVKRVFKGKVQDFSLQRISGTWSYVVILKRE